jgi:hypothetical protein
MVGTVRDTRLGRRTLLVSLAAAIGGLAAAPFAPIAIWNWIPLHRQWIDRRLTAALREVTTGSGSDLPGSAGTDWSRRRAVSRIAGDASHLELEAVLADEHALRNHLEQLQQQDFRTGLTQLHDGWLLSETEIAVAVLLGG